MGSRLEVNSTNTRKRIESHTFDGEDGEEYEASTFGGFTDYMRRKKIKLQNLDAEIRANAKDNPPVFRGVVAHVNGYTQPSLSDLHALIVGYGGGFQQYLDGKTAVTHVIASNLTPKKKVEFQRYRIVQPQWVIDSVRAGKLQPWDQYRVVDEGVAQKVLGFDNGRVISQANSQKQGYRDQTDSSWYTTQMKRSTQETGHNDGLPNASLMLPPNSARKQLSELDGGEDVSVNALEPPAPEELEQGQTNDSPSWTNIHEQVSGPESARSTRITSDPQFKAEFLSMEHRMHNHQDERRGHDSEEFIDSISMGIGPSETHHDSPSRVKSPEKKTLTAEEHNAILLADPRMRKSSTVNPDFLKQYYQESRLHHLSTWKAELKSQLQALTLEKTSSQKERQKRAQGTRRYVMHVDFDSFFATVSLLKHPELIAKPVVVAHGTGAGSEIASCNYPARAFGVKNGMWMKTALQLCPDLKVLPYEFKAYEEASRLFYDAILATDGIVQSVSIDEALVDITAQVLPAGGTDGKGVQEGSIFREQAKADEIAQVLRDNIKEKTGCAVSVGIGNNILLAKVALRKAKPAGQYQIKPEEVLDFLGELTVQDLPGVAYSIGGKLEEIGVKFVKDIRGLTKERLVSTLGPKTGEKLWDYSRGIDRVEVGEQVIRKSVSAEVNWGIRFVTHAQADEFVQSLCDELHRRLVEQAVKGRQLTMKIMRRAADAPLDPPKHLGHGKCDTFNKSILLGVATNDKVVLGREAISVLKGFGFSPGELRGLGVQMTKLEPLKPSTNSLSDSSQKRLQFKQTDLGSKLKDPSDPIEEVESPEKPRGGPLQTITGLPKSDNNEQLLNVTGTQFVLPSQIDASVLAELPSDVRSKLVPHPTQLTTSKPASRHHSPSSPTRELKSRSLSPFTELPSQSQIDPETLSALPEDVQKELRSYYAQSSSTTRKGPSQQLLPQSPRKLRPSGNLSKKTQTTPTKKKGTSLFSRSKTSKFSASAVSTLTQSAFVSSRPVAGSIRDGATTPPPKPKAISEATNDISPSFLEALPPDIRAEILAQQRQERMIAKSGLSVSVPSKPRPRAKAVDHDDAEALPGGQRTLKIPKRKEKPSFTSRKLTEMGDLREAIKGWVEMFKEPMLLGDRSIGEKTQYPDSDCEQSRRRRSQMGIGDGFDPSSNRDHPSSPLDGDSNPYQVPLHGSDDHTRDDDDDDGPYEEDTLALSIYLSRVVTEEDDLTKASDLVKWLDWCIRELVPSVSEVSDRVAQQTAQAQLRERWNGVIRRLKGDVEAAVGGSGRYARKGNGGGNTGGVELDWG